MLRLALLVLFIVNYGTMVNAKVAKVSANFVFEGTTINVAGTKLTSTSNPAKAILVDGSGDQVGEDLELVKVTPLKFRINVPTVSSTKSLLLRITGGDVTDDDPDDFPVVIFDTPDLTTPDPDPVDDEITANNVVANKVTFQSTALSGDANGNLLWNNKKIANSSGALTPKSITLNGTVLGLGTNGSLIWNSHAVATASGKIQASSVANGNTVLSVANGGTRTIVLNTSNGNANLTLPTAGFIAGTLRGEYSFATDGGATGTINLRNATLPNKARVVRAWYEVTTALTSASSASSIGFSIPTDDANGILAPIAISDGTTPWALGLHSTIQNGLVTNISEKTTAARNIQMTVSGEAITAGKLTLYAEYVIAP